jgi:hypothetical protein
MHGFAHKAHKFDPIFVQPLILHKNGGNENRTPCKEAELPSEPSKAMPYAFHPSFVDPQNNSARVWRYMDLAKLLVTIDKQALFFPSAAILAKDDQFEGQPPFPEIQDLIDELPNLSDEQIRATTGLPNKAAFRTHLERKKRHYHQFPLFHHLNFFNCWHMNDGESDAMWKLYVKEGSGIAIQSTVDRLKGCFANTDRPVHIGLVQYIDYEQTPPPVSFLGTSWFVCKRKAFAHEQELRVGVWSEEVEVRYMKNDGSLGRLENHDWQDIVLKQPNLGSLGDLERAHPMRLAPVPRPTPGLILAPAFSSRASVCQCRGDHEQEYFADGITESLTVDLSRISGAFVMARNTAFAYKGKAIDLRQIGRDLNVRYGLEGACSAAATGCASTCS